MAYEQFDRFRVKFRPLSERSNKLQIEQIAVRPEQVPQRLSPKACATIAAVADKIRSARAAGRPVICAFGAHCIKNGLGPLLALFIERGWMTHLATNGAGVIHDWEFSFQGQSSEDVRKMVQEGSFGNWEETGFSINLALNIGAYNGKGYGQSVGSLIENEGLEIPPAEQLEAEVQRHLADDPLKSAAAADLLWAVRTFGLSPGRLAIAHPFKRFSLQAAAWRLGVPFTAHPMIGHDIIYNHPMNHCAALGRCAHRDFLAYAQSVSRLEGGVYLSIGSAVMSPMIFEKSLSMAQNLAIQGGGHIDNHLICVVDLAAADWDWSRGEPPYDNPAFYLRYNKTFSRMGGALHYVQADNCDFLLALYHELQRA